MHSPICQSLLRQAELCRQECVLDELVHQTAQSLGLDKLNCLENDSEQEDHISGIEVAASLVNNAGYEAQLEFLLDSGVEPETIRSLLME
jgi:hypothetical protein